MEENKLGFKFGDNQWVDVNKSLTIEIMDTITVTDENNTISLDVKIIADINDVPEKYHEIFFNVITSKYLNKVNFNNNPFSSCYEKPKKKWYSIFKIFS